MTPKSAGLPATAVTKAKYYSKAVMDTIETYSNIPFQTILIFDDSPFKRLPDAVKSEPLTSCFSEI
jgi:hypothetical protein